MQKKKRPQGLSTHHPNGCKDTVSSLPDQKYSIKKHNLTNLGFSARQGCVLFLESVLCRRISMFRSPDIRACGRRNGDRTHEGLCS